MYRNLTTRINTIGVRYTHNNTAKSVPSPRGQITDVQTFLKTIGRNCESFADKFEVVISINILYMDTHDEYRLGNNCLLHLVE
ncbi:hypothetical protein BCV72DRAFT_328089 [Rhizopus microsporus var. microsporus]|uniref:Small ribosomal subunit protein mS41 SAM domain-containing protein n=1 Tax=Rhizopus microsporus var. microsporus TaxID=86635 RepID=A0A1X0R449_RHIZD|nr:hypothetical protein BCV72DRAFT_328089 [Rhizopus microsporus var. microsporus]